MKYLITVLTGLFIASAALQGAIRGGGDLRVVLESTSPIVSGTSDDGNFSTSGVATSVGSLSNSEAGTFQNYADVGANALVPTAAPTTPVVSLVETSGTENDGFVLVGERVQLTVEVTADRPLYSWFYSPDGEEFTALEGGADGATLDIPEAITEDSGYFRVRVANGGGEAFSEPVRLTVLEMPMIEADLTDKVVTDGDSVDYAVEATVPGTAFYQWFKDGDVIEDATNAILSLSEVTGESEGVYSVEVSNEVGSVMSADSTLSVIEVPVILEQPEDVEGPPSGSVTLSVDARTEGEITYKWFKDGLEIFDSDNSSLTISNLELADKGMYFVTISNEAGSVTSADASLNITADESEVPSALAGSEVVSIGEDSVTYTSEWFGEFTVYDDWDFGWVETRNLGILFITPNSTAQEAYIYPLVISDILFTNEVTYPNYTYWIDGNSWMFLPSSNDISTGQIFAYFFSTDEWVTY